MKDIPYFILRVSKLHTHATGEGILSIGNLSLGVAGFVIVDGKPLAGHEAAYAVADAYKQYGINLSYFLLGQYCSVVYDKIDKSVVLIQDSLGVRSVYWQTIAEEEVVISSDLKAMLKDSPSRILDKKYFYYYLAFGARAFGHTPYARIHRLSMGETVVLTTGGERHLFPWRPPANLLDISDLEAGEQLQLLVQDAVQATLPRHGNTLCELSGGLDSSTVVCTAFQSRSDITALTFTSASHSSGDDPIYAAKVVQHLGGLQWGEFEQDRFPPFSTRFARPEAEPGGEIRVALRNAYYQLLDDNNFEIVLTGAGGDQVFGSRDVAPIHIADGMYELAPLRSWRDSTLFQKNASVSRSETFWFWHYGLRGAVRHLRRRSLVYNTTASTAPPWLSPLVIVGDVSPTQVPHRLRRPSHQHYWEMLLRLADHESLVSNQRTPAEFRHPLLFRPLAEFMIGLDSRHRRGEQGDRALQREALRELLPDIVRERVDKSSNQPLRERAFCDNQDWMTPLVDEPHLLRLGWIRPKPWTDALDRARFGVVSHPMALDAAMCVEHWLRLNDIG